MTGLLFPFCFRTIVPFVIGVLQLAFGLNSDFLITSNNL